MTTIAADFGPEPLVIPDDGVVWKALDWTQDDDTPYPLAGVPARLHLRDKPGGTILWGATSDAGERSGLVVGTITCSDGSPNILITGPATVLAAGGGPWDLILWPDDPSQRRRLVEGEGEITPGVTE